MWQVLDSCLLESGSPSVPRCTSLAGFYHCLHRNHGKLGAENSGNVPSCSSVARVPTRGMPGRGIYSPLYFFLTFHSLACGCIPPVSISLFTLTPLGGISPWLALARPLVIRLSVFLGDLAQCPLEMSSVFSKLRLDAWVTGIRLWPYQTVSPHSNRYSFQVGPPCG